MQIKVQLARGRESFSFRDGNLQKGTSNVFGLILDADVESAINEVEEIS